MAGKDEITPVEKDGNAVHTDGTKNFWCRKLSANVSLPLLSEDVLQCFEEQF